MRTRPDEGHELLCELTDEEVSVKGNQLAEAEAALTRAEEEKTAAAKVFGQRIETARGACKRLAEEVLSRTERRPVVCRWMTETNDNGTEMWLLRRTDTGRVLQTQPVTAADRQLELL